jgi:hypothetical protein
VFVYKAHPPVHIRALDGRKDKKGGAFIFFRDPKTFDIFVPHLYRFDSFRRIGYSGIAEE